MYASSAERQRSGPHDVLADLDAQSRSAAAREQDEAENDGDRAAQRHVCTSRERVANGSLDGISAVVATAGTLGATVGG